MGKPIVYCVNCGSSLREDDFQRRQAWMLDNRPWCATCKPLPAEAPVTPGRSVPSRRPSSGQVPAATPRRPLPVAAPRSKAPFLLGAVLGVLPLALLAVFLLNGSPAPAPLPPVPDPSSEAKKTTLADAEMEDLERFAAEGGDPRAVLARALRLRGSPHAKRLNAVEDRARASLETAPTAEATDRYIAMIRELRERDVYFQRRGEAKNLIAATRRQAGARAAEIDQLEADYDRAFEEAARQAAAAAVADARALAAKGQVPEAIARLEDVAPVFADTEPVRKLSQVREELLREPAPPAAAPAEPPSIVLRATVAKVRDLSLKKDEYLGNWHTDGGAAEWMAAPAAGRWKVDLVYAADSLAGGTLVVTLGASQLEWEVVSTGSFQAYRTVSLGTVAFPGGATKILARGKSTHKEGLLNLREIRLTPAP
jgi:hypothetical protein